MHFLHGSSATRALNLAGSTTISVDPLVVSEQEAQNRVRHGLMPHTFERAFIGPRVHPSLQIYIPQIPDDMQTHEDVRRYFSAFGMVARVCILRLNGRPVSRAFVTFHQSTSAAAAIAAAHNFPVWSLV